MPPEPAPHVSTLIRPWFGVSRGAGGTSRVTFVWEPAARVPGDRVRRQVARLILTARSADGTVLFEGPVAPTGPAAIDDPGATPSRAVFDMAPGRLRLRMSIQDAASQVLDQDVRELSVRDLRGDVAIGTPQVLRARNAREFRTLGRGGGGAGGVARVQPDRAPADPLPGLRSWPARRPRCLRSCSAAPGTRCAI